MADFLALTERGTSQPVVSRYVGGFSRTVLSAPFGTNLGSDDVISCSQQNCVIQTDANTLYAVLFDGLYRSQDGGATFPTQVMIFTDPATDLTRRINHGGIHLAYDAGAQELILGGWVATSISSTIKGWTYNLTTGTPGAQVNKGIALASDTGGHEVLFGTTIHFTYGTSTAQSSWLSFDIVTASWASYSSPATGGGGGAIGSTCVGPDGALYRVYGYTSGVLVWQLWRFQGAWALQGNLYAANGNGVEGNLGNARAGLFSDGTDLHAVLTVGGNQGLAVGWKHFHIKAFDEFDPTLADDLTLLVVPAALRSQHDGGLGTSNATKRCIVIQDTETTPGTRRTFLAFSDDANPGTSYFVYEFQGIGGLYSLVGSGSGSQVRDGLPGSATNGGAYFFTPGQDGIRILSVTPEVGGGERIAFVASGGGTVSVRFRIARKQQAAVTQATLIGTATGVSAVRNVDQVDVVTANGTQVTTVVWDFITDMIANGEGFVVLVPEVI